ALPMSHNLPLAWPGVQGYMLSGGKVVLSASTRPDDLFQLIQRHRVTHLKVVPALLIRLINDPSIGRYDLSSLRVIQSGGQRMQPEVRLRTRELIPSAFVQENFGMSEGMLFFVRAEDPEDVRLETCGQLRSRGAKEGSRQPGRREDQRRGDRKPDSFTPLGAEHRLRAHTRSESGREDVRLRDLEKELCSHAQGAGRVSHGKGNRQ